MTELEELREILQSKISKCATTNLERTDILIDLLKFESQVRKEESDIFKPKHFVKIKGDSGVYAVWVIDWLQSRVKVYRANDYEWIHFKRIIPTQTTEDSDESSI